MSDIRIHLFIYWHHLWVWIDWVWCWNDGPCCYKKIIHIYGSSFQGVIPLRIVFNKYWKTINGCPSSGPELFAISLLMHTWFKSSVFAEVLVFREIIKLCLTPRPQTQKKSPDMSIVFTFFQIFSSILSTGPYQHPSYGGGSGGHGQDVISCFRCGDVCKGEVVRVQNVHFHVKCFTCQGMEFYSSFTKS